VRIGKLRHKVDIQRVRNIQDEETGEIKKCWVHFKSVRASIEPLSVTEFIQSDSTQSQVSVRIGMRYVKGLLPTMRIVHQGTIYNPQGILPDPKSGKRHITIPCSTGVNDGE